MLGGGCARPGGTRERGVPTHVNSAPAEPGRSAKGSGRGATGDKATCGVMIVRMRFDTAALLAFVSSDWWQPMVSETDTPRELFLYGGDALGAFRRRVSYEWGRIGVADKERKRKHKGRRGVSYD
jgi:formylglycine-generating enzyme